MPQWTDFRDTALDALKDGAMNVAEDTKQTFLNNFIEAGLPVVEQYAAQFVDGVKAQAANEQGWTKIRDAVVIPFAVQIGLYVGKQLITLVEGKTAEATA